MQILLFYSFDLLLRHIENILIKLMAKEMNCLP